ncbi:Putative flippase GtrA (transmembrane translocase of bactoprenol-linked glucose) [Amycolatopsis marina]|uniref:Flippase GtrA (Transmembrane translocase of bactoprenol-linked glucose) n=1 Tax=Amycolatopsis marina TaxID=490629 RepID=A0A1I0XHP5_9PSEU|nr:GtrA family protein [Amycolatopsis marina]SFB00197.1 Putative flippase GtrA (transmembrane translocase of bactoprenol-linked glucose) [Amycolatopsis marina]
MAIQESTLAFVPQAVRTKLIEHREFLKFAVVGAAAFVVDNGVWFLLKLSVLTDRPTTAKGIAILVATAVSYVLNREWSFNARAGRQRRHDAPLFFLVSAAALVVNLVPLMVSRYVLHLETPNVSWVAQETADFVSGSVIGVALAMSLRFWCFRRWVFPEELGMRRRNA